MDDLSLIYQKVDLQFDIENRIVEGTTSLWLTFTKNEADQNQIIRLNCRQCKVNEVRINNTLVEFDLIDPLSGNAFPSYYDAESFDLHYRGFLLAAQEGELAINLPDFSETNFPTTPLPSSGHTGVPILPSHAPAEALAYQKDAEIEIQKCDPPRDAILVTVNYTLDHPQAGICFANTSHGEVLIHTKHSPSPIDFDGVRCWLPCIDTTAHSAVIEIFITVPHIENLSVVCSGTSLGVQNYPDTGRQLHHFVTISPVVASGLGFVIGDLMQYSPPLVMAGPTIHTLYPVAMEAGDNPGELSEVGGMLTMKNVARVATNLDGAVQFFEEFLGAKFPYPSYSQVLLEGLLDHHQLHVAFSVIPAEIIPEAKCPEGNIPCNIRQVETFIHAWTRAAIHLKSWKESWIQHGVAGYLVNLYIERVCGRDVYRHRLWRTMNEVCVLDRETHSAPIVPQEDWEILDFMSPKMMRLVQLKSYLLLNMIESRIGSRDTMQKALRFIFRHASKPHANGNDMAGLDSAEAMETEADEMGHSGAQVIMPLTLNSKSFLKIFRDFAGPAGKDLKEEFIRQWVMGGGVAKIRAGACFNRRTTQCEVVLEQVVPPWGKPYVGVINIQIIEIDGKFENMRRIDQKRYHWQFQCHSAIRRRAKRKVEDNAGSNSAIMMARDANTSPVLWVVIDPDFMWIREVSMRQPDYMWTEQLFMDPDVASQCAALHTLTEYPITADPKSNVHTKSNVQPATTLSDCIRGNLVHMMPEHRPCVQVEAALRLALWQLRHAPSNATLDVEGSWKGLHNLRKAFDEKFVDSSSGLLLPNWWDISKYEEQRDYLIKKSLVFSIMSVKTKQGVTLPEIGEFAFQLLDENDNSENTHSDSQFVSLILASLPMLMLGEEDACRSKLLEQCKRYLQYDLQEPTPYSKVAACALQAAGELELQRAGRPTLDYHLLTGRDFPIAVRLSAVQSAFRIYGSEEREASEQSEEEVGGFLAAIDWGLTLVGRDDSPKFQSLCLELLVDVLQKKVPRCGYFARYGSEPPIDMQLDLSLAPSTTNFKCPILSECSSLRLKQDSEPSRKIILKIWDLMTSGASYSQIMRYQLLEAYKAAWGWEKPAAAGAHAELRPVDWAGGLDSVLDVLKDRREDMVRYKRYVGDWLVWAKEQSKKKKPLKMTQGSINK